MGDSNDETIKSFLWALDASNTGKAFAHRKTTGYYLNQEEQNALSSALAIKGIGLQRSGSDDCFITEAEAKKLNLDLHTRTPGDEGYTFKKNGVTVIDGNAEDRQL